MDKQEYLSTTHERLNSLINDETFRNNLSQVRARAIQEELVSDHTETGFTFDADKIWKYCDYIFSESSLLLREKFENGNLTKQILEAAQGFEFLSKFAKEDEKEILLINSAMCYHISGYQANAQCIAKFVERNYLPEAFEDTTDNMPDEVLTSFFRVALINFLKRDVSTLQQTTATALDTIQSLQETITRGLAEQNLSTDKLFDLTAHAYFHQALADFVQYCLTGNANDFSNADTNLNKSFKYFQNASDTTFGTITSELRTVLELFNERSTWSNISKNAENLLEDKIWQTYLKYLALDKSIVEFWLSQLRAIRSGILTSEDSFVIQMPTSAGKTLVAELAILAALTQKDDACCLYIAPYRALVNEIESNLAETLGAVGYRVANIIGGFEFDASQDFLIRKSDVLVITPEKVELLFRVHPDYFENLAIVIIDEGHILDEGIPSPEELGESETLLDKLNEQGYLGRGPLLELLITRLKHRLPNNRFIFLSAVMPEVNANDFVEWLSKNRQEPLKIDRTDRPSRLVMAKFEWRSQENGELDYISLPQLPGGRSPFVPFFIQRQQYFTGGHTPKTGKRERKSWPDIGRKTQTAAMLASQFAKTDPVLVFCAQKNHVSLVIENIITTLKYLEASDRLPNEKLKYVAEPSLESFDLAVEWLGEEHLLTQALHYGVGLHYGPLPDPVRQAVESEFRSGKIQILVSTNTLGQGVNMPVKTAIIYSLERRWGQEESETEKIKKRDFWNICGRAGRAGKETEGQVIFVVISPNDEALLNEFKEYSNLEEVQSALYKLLEYLVETRISQDDLIGFLDSHILPILAEEMIDTQDEDEIKDFLGTSLVGVQAIRKGVDLDLLVSAVQNTATWVINRVPDESLRRVYSSTGLRVTSCEQLEAAVDLFLESITEELFEIEKENLYCNEDLLHAAFEGCQYLPEMILRGNIDYTGPQDEFEIIQNWVIGEPIRELRSGFWSPTQSESFSEYVADRLIYKLPWGFNGFLLLLEYKSQRSYENLPMTWQYLPSMMKFGVNNVVACWANSLGVASRKLALHLADTYHPEERVTFPGFTKWLADLAPEFIFEELEGFDFEKQQLLRSINKIALDRTQQSFIRNEFAEIASSIRGIPYHDQDAVLRVNEGSNVVLELDPTNRYDPNAIKVLFEGEKIGYIERSKAKIIAKDMQLGRKAKAQVTKVKPPTASYAFPWIDLVIQLNE